MLRSIVVHLKALEQGYVPPLIAPAIHAEFLRWLPEKERDHANSDRRPFTVSDLLGRFETKPGGWRKVDKGQRVSFRLTLLQDMGVVLPQIGQEISLTNLRFQFQQVSIDDGDWARESSYQSLVDQYKGAGKGPMEVIKVAFESTTTFHTRGNLHAPIPIPEKVFGSWLARWAIFSPIKKPHGVADLSAARIGISQYKLETHGVPYDDALWIGFAGYCHFRVFTEDVNTLRLANTLADFAFYCGTGVKLSFGLGQTRRIR